MTRFILTLLILTALPVSAEVWQPPMVWTGETVRLWDNSMWCKTWTTETYDSWLSWPCPDTVYAKPPCEHDRALDKHIRTLIEHLHDFQKFWIVPCKHGYYSTSGAVWYNVGDTAWAEPSMCNPFTSDTLSLREGYIPMPPDGEKCGICGETRMRKE